MTLSAHVSCDRGNAYGTCPAHLILATLNPALIRAQAERRGWRFDTTTGRALCDRHANGAAL